MNRRFQAIKGVNRITAASLVAALGLSLSTAPAFAEGRDGSGSGKSGDSTLPAESSEQPTTTTRRSGGIEVTGYLATLIGQIEGSNVDPSVKAGLLARLRAARETFLGGGVVDAPTMQALIGDVRAALGVAPTGEKEKSETESSRPTSSRPTTSSEKREDSEGKSPKSDRTAPPPTGADGAPLPTSSSKKGERADRGEFGTEAESDADSSTSTTLAGTPRGKAAESIAKEIERIKNSDLAPAVKDKVIALLTDARQHVEDDRSTSDDGAEVRARIEAERKARLQETAAKLAKMAVKIEAFVDRAEAVGVPADAIAKARDQVAQANALIASATSADDLRAAWTLLREARIGIATLLEPPPTTVSTPVETTTTTVPDQETTTTTAGG
ncbi:MAG: hypothetical protein AB7L13_10830 [Acidimicrobiia bacterium]